MEVKELAKRLGISHQMANRLKGLGMPTDSVESAQDWRNRCLNPLSMKQNRIDGNPGLRRNVEAPGANMAAYHEHKRVKEYYLAMQAKEDYERTMAALIERAEVERDLVKVEAILKGELMRFPGNVSGKIASESDPNAIHAVLTVEIERTLTRIANRVGRI